MTTIFSIILLLIAVVAANILYLVWPKIPLSFYQIIAGLVLSLDPQYNHFTFEPELFMIIIIAPLMFNDGQNQAMKNITRNLSTTLSLAIGLAVISVIAVGFFTHWLWPYIALPLAFMLGAIITPTDAVAVKSITRNVILPDEINDALEHESLFNDASGIVLYSLALSAFVNGQFSVAGGVLSFMKVFFGGIIFGLIVGMFIVRLRMTLTQSHADISAIVVPVNVMTPIVVYWLAERLGLSGILAVVAAGLVHSALYDNLKLTSTKLQIVTSTTWDILSDILNGFVFVLLGATLPTVVTDINNSKIVNSFIIAIALYLLLIVLRYIWIITNRARLNRHKKNTPDQAWKMAISGIHGTMTLAMAFALPEKINGVDFALRPQLIFIAALVILLSLIVPTVLYPFVLPKRQEAFSAEDFNQHIKNMVGFAIESLRQGQKESRELDMVIKTLNSQTGFSYQIDRKSYMALSEKTREVEQNYISKQNEAGKIPDETLKMYNRYMQRVSTQHSLKFSVKLLVSRIKLKFNHSARKKWQEQRQHVENHPEIKQQWIERQSQTLDILNGVNTAVDKYLDTIETPENRNEVSMLRYSYSARNQHFEQRDSYSSDVTNKLFISAFQFEYSYVQEQLAADNIVQELANRLNEQISMDEMVYMQELSN